MIASQQSVLDKLCPPLCLYSNYPSLNVLKASDASSDSRHQWLDNPFTINELNLAISSFNAPGIDQIYYSIKAIPYDLREVSHKK